MMQHSILWALSHPFDAENANDSWVDGAAMKIYEANGGFLVNIIH